MKDFFTRLAFNCKIASPSMDITEYCMGADNVSIFESCNQIRIMKTVLKDRPENNDVKAIAVDFVYTEIIHPDKIVPEGLFWFKELRIKKGYKETVPDYEATGEKIKSAFDKLGLKVTNNLSF